MTHNPKEVLEGLTKVLVILGAFLSAGAGTYLGIDSVAEGTTDKFRTFWYWLPLIIVIPISYSIAFFIDSEVAKKISFVWFLIILFSLSITIVTIRFTVFWREKTKMPNIDARSKKAGWAMLVLGFDLLFFGALIDGCVFFYF